MSEQDGVGSGRGKVDAMTATIEGLETRIAKMTIQAQEHEMALAALRERIGQLEVADAAADEWRPTTGFGMPVRRE